MASWCTAVERGWSIEICARWGASRNELRFCQKRAAGRPSLAMARLHLSGRVLALRMRRGRRARHAAAELAPGASDIRAFRRVASFYDVAAFHHDTAVTRDNPAGCIESETSSGHDRIADDASASGGKDADQRTGAGKAAGTESPSQSSPSRRESSGAHAARCATAGAGAGTGANCPDQPVTVRGPYSRRRDQRIVRAPGRAGRAGSKPERDRDECNALGLAVATDTGIGRCHHAADNAGTGLPHQCGSCRGRGRRTRNQWRRLRRAALSMRGFSGDAINHLYNGINIGIQDLTGRTQDTFSFDRIEFLKGASAIESGVGSIGGSVNYVTKQPFSGPVRNETFISADSFRSMRTGFDSGGSTSLAGLDYRVVASYADVVGFIDDTKKELSTLTARWNYQNSDILRTWIAFEYYNDQGNYYWGTPITPTSFSGRYSTGWRRFRNVFASLWQQRCRSHHDRFANTHDQLRHARQPRRGKTILGPNRFRSRNHARDAAEGTGVRLQGAANVFR